MSTALRLALVVALVAAAYAGVASAGFVWDDRGLVLENAVLRAPTFENVFQRDLWCCSDGDTSGYYRPLMALSLLLDRTLFGYAPAGYHLHSLLLHLGVVLVVAALLDRRVGAARAAAAALIFGLHPLQSEAVVWIAARNDVLAALFGLGTLLLLDRGRPALAAATALAACLAKENAFLLPLVAWIWRRAWGERLGHRELVALGIGLAAAAALRAQATLDGLPLDSQEVAFDARSATYALITVLGWATWPWPLTSTASLHMPAPHPAAWPAAAATLALLVALVRVGGARAAWLLALGAVVFAPAAMGIRWYGTIGERYLYLPVFGLVAAVVATAPARRWASPALVAFAVASLAALHVRLPDWANEETLFAAAVRRAPDAHARHLLGAQLLSQERYGEALAVLEEGLAHDPVLPRTCPLALHVAARVLPDDLLLERARLWADRGCRGQEGYDGGYALVLAQRGRWDEAATVAETAVRNDVKLRRDEIVRAALDARAGDLASFGARALRWPKGAADLRLKVDALLQLRPRPGGGTAPSEPAGVASPAPPVYPSAPSESP